MILDERYILKVFRRVEPGPNPDVEVTEGLSGLDIEGYLVTGFLGFRQLVDAFGGVFVDVPFGMAEPKSQA